MHLRGIKQMVYYALKLFFPLQWGLSRNSSWTPGPAVVKEAADVGSAGFAAALWICRQDLAGKGRAEEPGEGRGKIV